MGKFFTKTLRTFRCFSDFWIKIVMIIKSRVALGLTLNIFRFYLGGSLTVLNPDFTRVIRKSVIRYMISVHFESTVRSGVLLYSIL